MHRGGAIYVPLTRGGKIVRAAAAGAITPQRAAAERAKPRRGRPGFLKRTIRTVWGDIRGPSCINQQGQDRRGSESGLPVDTG